MPAAGELPRVAPPAAGWSLMEAAEALFPEQVRRIWAGDREPSDVFASLGSVLMKAIAARTDLVLSGRDASRPLDPARVLVPVDLYESGTFIHLDILAGEMRIGPSDRWTYLTAVRVHQAPDGAGAAPATVSAPGGASSPELTSRRPVVRNSAGGRERPSDETVRERIHALFRGREASPKWDAEVWPTCKQLGATKSRSNKIFREVRQELGFKGGPGRPLSVRDNSTGKFDRE